MKTIITVQHTQSQQHVNKMIGSWADWELTEQGVMQAHLIGERLFSENGKEKFCIYSSDLLRTTQTADIIASYFDTPIQTTEALREYYLGEAVGKSKAWARENLLCQTWDGMIDWPKRINDRPFHNAETIREAWDRIYPFFVSVLESKEDNIIIVAHDGTLRLFFAMWLGISVEMQEGFQLAGKSGGVSLLHQYPNGERMILRLNDLSYLK